MASIRSGEAFAIMTAIKKRSILEKCCGMKIAPIILSKIGRFVTFCLYLLFLITAAILISQLDIYFDQLLFVSKESEIYEWFAANEKYFTTGTLVPTEIYV